ncbi:hypothetical protein ACOMHN_002611 [Nucella lapillus]
MSATDRWTLAGNARPVKMSATNTGREWPTSEDICNRQVDPGREWPTSEDVCNRQVDTGRECLTSEDVCNRQVDPGFTLAANYIPSGKR